MDMKMGRATKAAGGRPRDPRFQEQPRRFESSGKTAISFCKDEGVALSTFYQRRARVKNKVRRVRPAWINARRGSLTPVRSSRLPRYAKIRCNRVAFGWASAAHSRVGNACLPAPNSNFLQKASNALQQIEQEIKADDKALVAPAKKERVPVTVRVEAAEESALETLRHWAGPLIGPASTIGLVMVFLFFLLLQREDIRDRFIRLVSKQQMHVTTDAIDDAAQRVSRYLLRQRA